MIPLDFQSILPWSAWNFQSILLISPGISSRFYWSPLEFLFYFIVIPLDFQSILPWSAWNFQSILLISPGISILFYRDPAGFSVDFIGLPWNFQSILLISPGISSRFYWSPLELLFYFTVIPLDFQSILLVSSQFYRELLGYSIRFNRNWYPPGIYGNSPPSFSISVPWKLNELFSTPSSTGGYWYYLRKPAWYQPIVYNR